MSSHGSDGPRASARLLNTIEGPQDLRRLSPEDLVTLAEEIRRELVKTVACRGGHLAPNLGVVELTLALLYVFEPPTDRIVWDVGHQAYTYKLLTGRRERFDTLRTHGGLCGFPARRESQYDCFGTGHSSTSISAALGMSVAKQLKRDRSRVVAVIGDGSMTAGLAFEGLNHAGDLDRDLIVVLNDNEMSISPNVGALSSFLSRKLTGKTFRSLKKDIESVLKSVPGGDSVLQLARKGEESLKGFLTPGMLFEALKFKYVGPLQGHNIPHLIESFENLRQVDGPVLVHVLTTKGKGYRPAECDPTSFHGIGPFDAQTGKCFPGGGSPSYTQVFGQCLAQMAEDDPRIIGITAAMPEGTGLSYFRSRVPTRFFDVGIAEQHAVTFAAGMATEGFLPVVAVYSTFLQRAYDQVIHDVCLQNLHVVFALDRAGIVGEDGPTHHGLFDLSFLRAIPNMVIMAPRDGNELRHLLLTALDHQGPVALRYPRGFAQGFSSLEPPRVLPLGKGELLRDGKDAAFIAVGSTVAPALAAAESLEAEGISCGVFDARFVKPLDAEALLSLAGRVRALVTVEENALHGGFGSAVLELLQEHDAISPRLRRVGLPDVFVEHGASDLLRRKYGLDSESLAKVMAGLLEGSRLAVQAGS
ncbi:MAG: 1-deoxy-D-xylulose-5-phosphate synthase [Pseudomonadota bacterium]